MDDENIEDHEKSDEKAQEKRDFQLRWLQIFFRGDKYCSLVQDFFFLKLEVRKKKSEVAGKAHCDLDKNF